MMIVESKQSPVNSDSELSFIGFALGDCVVQLDAQSAKYLRAVHRAALELSVANRFGVEIGGFWLLNDQIEELRRFSNYYPPNEAVAVARAVEAYLHAQLATVAQIND